MVGQFFPVTHLEVGKVENCIRHDCCDDVNHSVDGGRC
jgi:hypothetical protein